MSRSRVTVVLLALVLGAGLASALAFAKASGQAVRNGGTFRISLWHEHFDFARAASTYKIQRLGNEAGLPSLADIEAVRQEFKVGA